MFEKIIPKNAAFTYYTRHYEEIPWT